MKSKNNYFSRLLFAIVILVILITISLSGILYLSFENISVKFLADSNMERLKNINYCYDFLQSTAKSLSVQVYFDSAVKELFFKDPSIVSIGTAISRLSSFVNSSPYVASIYVYSFDNDTLYTSINIYTPLKSSNFFDQDIIRTLFSSNDNQAFKMYTRKATFGSSGNTSFYYTFMFHETSINNRNVTDTVIINFAEDWMTKSIGNVYGSLHSVDFFIDRKGSLMVSTPSDDMNKNIAEREFVKTILNSKQLQGAFVSEYNNEKSLVTYITAKSGECFFVNIMPYETILSKVSMVKNVTAIVFMFVSIIGLIASLLIVKRLSKPYNSINDKLSHLLLKRQQEQNIYCNELLRNVIVSGLDRSNLHNFHQELSDLGIDINPEKPFFIILVRIKDYHDFNNRYNNADRTIVKFGIVKTLEDNLRGSIKLTGIDLGGDAIVLLCNKPDDFTTIQDLYLEQVLLESQKRIHENFNCILFFSLSYFSEDITNVDKIYQNAYMLSRYNIFFNTNGLLTEEILDMRIDKHYSYPAAEEKRMIDCLLMENVDEAVSCVSDILREASTHLFNVFEITVNRLTAAVGTVIDMLERNGDIDLGSVMTKLHINFDRLQSLDDIIKYFRDVFIEITVRINEMREGKPSELINRVIEFVTENYSDKNLSINSIANDIGMSSGYMGRIFKKSSNKSIAELINEIRLTKAEDLLRNSNLTVSEIADKIGVENSKYFYTLFKKTFGITPNEYRQRKRI